MKSKKSQSKKLQWCLIILLIQIVVYFVCQNDYAYVKFKTATRGFKKWFKPENREIYDERSKMLALRALDIFGDNYLKRLPELSNIE